MSALVRSRFDPPPRPGRPDKTTASPQLLSPHHTFSSGVDRWRALARSTAAVGHDGGRLKVAVGTSELTLPAAPLPRWTDATLPPEIAEFLIVERQHYDICEAGRGDTPESDALIDRREALCDAILSRPPRTLGDVLARAIISAARLSIRIDGTWRFNDVGQCEEVALSLLQVAGMTDGRRERGETANG